MLKVHGSDTRIKQYLSPPLRWRAGYHTFDIGIRRGAVFIGAQEHAQCIAMWFAVNEAQPEVSRRRFVLVPNGEAFPEEARDKHVEHRSSVQVESLHGMVLHLFEVKFG